MKKTEKGKSSRTMHLAIKYLLMVKFILIFLFATALQSFGNGYGQGKIQLKLNNVEIKQVLKALEAQGEYRFVYKDQILPKGYKVTIDVDNATIQEVMDKVLENTSLGYRQLSEQLIVITKIGTDVNAPFVKAVSGKVVNEQGIPLAGVTVKEKGTTNGTSTKEDGTFSLTVADGASLEISIIGYSSQTVDVGSQTNIIIRLAAQVNKLDEVVVIGYGVQKKSVVTGAISSVKAGDIDNQPIARVEQFLQGRASGLTIAASSGQPGSASTLRVRGTTSINNSDPLYVVDGIPVDIGGIDYLNPSDIESIEVLKDAASAAIYGTRAASGVILVTTKKGKAGRSVMVYNGYYGTQASAHKLDLLDATQYVTLRNEASLAGGGGLIFSNPASLGKGTDWQSLIFNKSAKIQDHELSISGGNDKSTFYTSFGYFEQEGIIATDISKYKRLNFRFNGTHKINNWLTVGSNLGYSHIKGVGIGGLNTEYGGILSSVVNLDPVTKAVITDPSEANAAPYLATNNNSSASSVRAGKPDGQGIVRDANGNPYGISSYVAQEMSNPLAYIKTHLGNFGWSDNLVGNAFLEVEPIKGFKVRTNLGAKYAFYGSESFNPYYFYNTVNLNKDHNSFYSESNRSLNYTWENTASYTHAFGKHQVTALIGTGAYVDNFSNRRQGTTIYDFPVNSFSEASNLHYDLPDSVKKGWAYEDYAHKISSVYARLNYNYAERYLIQGTVRRDGSSRFGSNNKYGYFPSGSIGWVASKEDFWPTNRYVNFLKVRGSYGVTGNDNIGDFTYVSTISGGRNYTFGSDYTFGNSPTRIANPDLRWEQTSQTDIGFDAVAFRDFTLGFDWYKKKTTGMLRIQEVPLYVGVGGPSSNIASMTNSGYELELGYKKTISGVKLEVSANISHLKNTVTFISNGVEYLTGAKPQSSQLEIARIQVGHPIGAFYGYETQGIFQTQAEINSYTNKSGGLIQPNAKPGDFRWADLNGDGTITNADRTFIGDPTPDWSYGLTVNASYHGFDVVVFGQGANGNQIYNALRRLDIPTANYTTQALNRWTGPGTSNTFPRLSTNDPNGNFSNPSSFYLEDGDYFRIKVLQLGYTLPNSIMSRIHLQKMRVYVSGNNLLTITKYTGYDPEIGGSSYGIDRGFYPQARSFTAGLNLTF